MIIVNWELEHGKGEMMYFGPGRRGEGMETAATQIASAREDVLFQTPLQLIFAFWDDKTRRAFARSLV